MAIDVYLRVTLNELKAEVATALVSAGAAQAHIAAVYDILDTNVHTNNGLRLDKVDLSHHALPTLTSDLELKKLTDDVYCCGAAATKYVGPSRRRRIVRRLRERAPRCEAGVGAMEAPPADHAAVKCSRGRGFSDECVGAEEAPLEDPVGAFDAPENDNREDTEMLKKQLQEKNEGQVAAEGFQAGLLDLSAKRAEEAEIDHLSRRVRFSDECAAGYDPPGDDVRGAVPSSCDAEGKFVQKDAEILVGPDEAYEACTRIHTRAMLDPDDLGSHPGWENFTDEDYHYEDDFYDDEDYYEGEVASQLADEAKKEEEDEREGPKEEATADPEVHWRRDEGSAAMDECLDVGKYFRMLPKSIKNRADKRKMIGDDEFLDLQCDLMKESWKVTRKLKCEGDIREKFLVQIVTDSLLDMLEVYERAEIVYTYEAWPILEEGIRDVVMKAVTKMCEMVLAGAGKTAEQAIEALVMAESR